MSHMIVCGSSWGMGVSMLGENEHCYGFPCVENPHDFYPDYELCTEKEIKAWKKAKEVNN